MSHVLDTNVASDYLRGVVSVVERIQAAKSSDLAISAVTAMELRYGASRRKSTKLTAAVDGFLAGITVVAFDTDMAQRAGTLRANLENRGVTLALADCQIAATALVLDWTLVSNDRDFKRVTGLRVVDWRQ